MMHPRFPFTRLLAIALTLVGALATAPARLAAADTGVPTEQKYLSGRGPKDAVPWEFSVTGGRRAGEWTTIPVPSQWELQGFGAYNYGEDGANRADEHGLYKLRFTVPENWKGKRIRIVFDGVMTDATVKINGRLAGPVHHGAFYRFHHDITSLVKLTEENLLEVDVAKVSANVATENAERRGDYWIFGGIFRPVYLEAIPDQAIENIAIDARADGSFKAHVNLATVRDAGRVEAQIFTLDGQPVGAPFTAEIPAGGAARVTLQTRLDAPRLWTAETPHLYSVRLNLRRADATLHTITERFGFRTFEVRLGEGFFLNGKRILLKGVCRHSFRPQTGRALNPEDCYDDARLIKAMNMNAARMSHYPPDKAFLEACDQLGLYVIDELSGWHRAHDTEVGRRLVREMVTRDVNHPSILFWDNANEGGWNRALDGDFALYDPQNRTVLHPWETFNGVDTKHYPVYEDLTKRLAGKNLLMPTEMLHGLYDGGAGAGLEDYWKAISASPVGGGGFIWVFADEGIVRTDQGNRIDVFSTFAPDGIVGPNHEKEGSFYTVRDLFSPVQIDPPALDAGFDGKLTLHNRYDFVSLGGCKVTWRTLQFPAPGSSANAARTIDSGTASAPDIAPGATGHLSLALPQNWREADALAVTVSDASGAELWQWTWPLPALNKSVSAAAKTAGAMASTTPAVDAGKDAITLRAGTTAVRFDATTGLLSSIQRDGKTYALTAGPRLAFGRPAVTGMTTDTVELKLEPESGAATGVLIARAPAPQVINLCEIELEYPPGIGWAGFKLEISADGTNWKTLYDATRRPRDGKLFEFPPQRVSAVRLSNFRRSDGQPAQLKSFRAGYQTARFPTDPTAPARLTHGVTAATSSAPATAWLEASGAGGLDRARWTLDASGGLRLEYAYSLSGDFSYHGITFDHPEEQMQKLRWLGAGPFRVWQNRLRGTWLGVHEVERLDFQPGETWRYPEFQGFFAGVRWAELQTANGLISVSNAGGESYLRVGTPRITHPNTTIGFPAGDFSVLHAIPAIGSKFSTPDKTGSPWAKASGSYSGTLTFRFDAAQP